MRRLNPLSSANPNTVSRPRRRRAGRRTVAQHLTTSTMALGIAAALVLASIGPADAAPVAPASPSAAQAVAP